ncbi:AraC family transcriptional regulator [Variovorax sp. LjRoot175]|uniref:AraC family transcriptional regulator n=1 Tax=Variovorax sp. LjRoot175 TaxID=3342276 RepID=UPI003ECC8FEF
MIQSPNPLRKVDRLTAFVQTFKLAAAVVPLPTVVKGPTLIVAGTADGLAGQVVFRSVGFDRYPQDVLVAAQVEFDNDTNPLMIAMPEELSIQLDEVPALRATVAAFLAEAFDSRCGRTAALDRLAEVIVLMVLRKAIDAGTAESGLLAALAHPALHRALVSIHDMPSRAWRVDDLAMRAGMSRSHFMALFRAVVGTTPMAYLSAWRLTLARRYLESGDTVKSVARRTGFGSAAAFSRAYSRTYGSAPAAARSSAVSGKRGDARSTSALVQPASS